MHLPALVNRAVRHVNRAPAAVQLAPRKLRCKPATRHSSRAAARAAVTTNSRTTLRRARMQGSLLVLRPDRQSLPRPVQRWSNRTRPQRLPQTNSDPHCKATRLFRSRPIAATAQLKRHSPARSRRPSRAARTRTKCRPPPRRLIPARILKRRNCGTRAIAPRSATSHLCTRLSTSSPRRSEQSRRQHRSSAAQ
jgi:hypothetical protein